MGSLWQPLCSSVVLQCVMLCFQFHIKDWLFPSQTCLNVCSTASYNNTCPYMGCVWTHVRRCMLTHVCRCMLTHVRRCMLTHVCRCMLYAEYKLHVCSTLGVPKAEWELAEKMKELESEHQQHLHQIDTMKQPLKWERAAPLKVPTKEKNSHLFGVIDTFTTKQVDNLAMDLAHQVNLYKEQVEHKTRVAETLVQHRNTTK